MPPGSNILEYLPLTKKVIAFVEDDADKCHMPYGRPSRQTREVLAVSSLDTECVITTDIPVFTTIGRLVTSYVRYGTTTTPPISVVGT